MRDLKVAILQLNQVWENPKANFYNISKWLENSHSCNLLLFPEMFSTGFTLNVNEYAEPWTQSESLDFLKTTSLLYKTAIYTSILIKSDGAFYNRGVFVSEGEVLAYYDKMQLFSFGNEDTLISPGKKNVIVHYLGWNINLQICFDLRFPELSRNSVLGEAFQYDLLLYTANWPQQRIAHWNALLKARAIENQAFVIGVNRVGIDGNGLVYSGESQALSPLGESFEDHKKESEQLMYFHLNKGELSDIRLRLPFLKQRRF